MWSVSLHPLRRKIWSLNPIYDAKEASDVSSFHDVDKIQAMSPIHGVGKKKKSGLWAHSMKWRNAGHNSQTQPVRHEEILVKKKSIHAVGWNWDLWGGCKMSLAQNTFFLFMKMMRWHGLTSEIMPYGCEKREFKHTLYRVWLISSGQLPLDTLGYGHMSKSRNVFALQRVQWPVRHVFASQRVQWHWPLDTRPPPPPLPL